MFLSLLIDLYKQNVHGVSTRISRRIANNNNYTPCKLGCSIASFDSGHFKPDFFPCVWFLQWECEVYKKNKCNQKSRMWWSMRRVRASVLSALRAPAKVNGACREFETIKKTSSLLCVCILECFVLTSKWNAHTRWHDDLFLLLDRSIFCRPVIISIPYSHIQTRDCIEVYTYLSACGITHMHKYTAKRTYGMSWL